MGGRRRSGGLVGALVARLRAWLGTDAAVGELTAPSAPPPPASARFDDALARLRERAPVASEPMPAADDDEARN